MGSESNLTVSEHIQILVKNIVYFVPGMNVVLRYAEDVARIECDIEERENLYKFLECLDKRLNALNLNESVEEFFRSSGGKRFSKKLFSKIKLEDRLTKRQMYQELLVKQILFNNQSKKESEFFLRYVEEISESQLLVLKEVFLMSQWKYGKHRFNTQGGHQVREQGFIQLENLISDSYDKGIQPVEIRDIVKYSIDGISWTESLMWDNLVVLEGMGLIRTVIDNIKWKHKTEDKVKHWTTEVIQITNLGIEFLWSLGLEIDFNSYDVEVFQGIKTQEEVEDDGYDRGDNPAAAWKNYLVTIHKIDEKTVEKANFPHAFAGPPPWIFGDGASEDWYIKKDGNDSL